jgi:hypothetical protein
VEGRDLAKNQQASVKDQMSHRLSIFLFYWFASCFELKQ